jgi:2-oxoglutarate dehydrogenase E2 component (dihydrolipoamide succinyltransferase)
VKSSVDKENITFEELSAIKGTGRNGRITKDDIYSYLEKRDAKAEVQRPVEPVMPEPAERSAAASGGDEIVKMDRMRKLIADHMLLSKQTSPHVTSFVEADVTNMVLWRNKNKDEFQKKYGVKLTYTPLFTEAVAKALRDYPGINASVDGDNIILRKNVNIGIAVVLPSGNLIVPVVKNADMMNVPGLAKKIAELAGNARNNSLQPDDIQGGTFTLTNVGTFGNIMGTPIIYQPQVAILAVGVIEKKPAVLETPSGDVIAIRQKMYLSLSYDHRVVDGALGGGFLKRVADHLEEFDINTPV